MASHPPARFATRLATLDCTRSLLGRWPRGDIQSLVQSACAALREPPAGRRDRCLQAGRRARAGPSESGCRPASPTARARSSAATLSILLKRRGPCAQPHDEASAAASTIIPIHRPIRTTPFRGSPAVELTHARAVRALRPRPESRRTLVKVEKNDNPNRNPRHIN